MTRRMVTLLLLALATTPLAAQGATPLAPGTRVRATLDSGGTRAGTVVALTADTLALQAMRGTDTMRIPVAGIAALDVSHGVKSRVGTGIKYGVLAGAVIGLVGGVASGATFSADASESGPSAAPALAVLGAGVGLLVGAMIGSSLRYEDWEHLPPEGWRIGVGTSPHIGLTLAMSVTF